MVNKLLSLDYYKKIKSNLENILDIVNSLTYTSFGIGGDISTAKTSIRNQTTSLIDFEDSFTMYYQGIQEMESNICSKLVKISTAVNKPIMPLEEAIQDAKAMHKDNRPQYAIDIENMKNSTNLLDGSGNFLAYLWDRFPRQFALYNEQAGLNNGLTPEWAKVYGDLSSGMLIENSAAVAINGVRSYKCLKTSESILEGDVFAGSGMRNINKIDSSSTVSKKAIEHIFHGNINGKGLPSGYHKPSIMSDATISNVSNLDKFGVYKATIEINGKSKMSSFFPDKWSRVDTLSAIKEAQKGITFNKPGWYSGKTNSGMEIKMWLNSNGLIDTAFPIYSK